MPPDLTEDDKAILIELLRETVEPDRFPMSPRVRSFKAILAKLAPPAPRPEALPPPKPPGRAQRGTGEEAEAVDRADDDGIDPYQPRTGQRHSRACGDHRDSHGVGGESRCIYRLGARTAPADLAGCLGAIGLPRFVSEASRGTRNGPKKS